MFKYVRQLCFILIGTPALVALALSASGLHGLLPYVGVTGFWITVHCAQNFRGLTSDSQCRLHEAFIVENLRAAVLSALVSVAAVVTVRESSFPSVVAQAVNLCVLGWWLAFTGWNLFLANLVALPEDGRARQK